MTGWVSNDEGLYTICETLPHPERVDFVQHIEKVVVKV
jgi:hypothetical protein